MNPQYSHRLGTRAPRFPNNIREYRLKAGLTQKRLGRLVGRSRSAICAWERGHALPSLPDVFRLARALNTLSEALYAGLYQVARKPVEA